MRSILALLIVGLCCACSERKERGVAAAGEAPAAANVTAETSGISPYLPALPKAYPIDVQNVSAQQVKHWLEALLDDDQKHREELHRLPREHDRETWRKIGKQDSLNQAILAVVLQKLGWPSEGTYGRKAAEGAFYVTIHAPYEFKKQYLPLLKAAAERNAADAKYYRVMQDRILISEGQPQQYGTHPRVNGSMSFTLDESGPL
jgi:rubrerythrin